MFASENERGWRENEAQEAAYADYLDALRQKEHAQLVDAQKRAEQLMQDLRVTVKAKQDDFFKALEDDMTPDEHVRFEILERCF